MVLTLNLPTFGTEVCRWRIVDELPKKVSIGQGSDGKFCTMVLKEYPPALCGAIAASFWHSLSLLPVDASVKVPCEFFQLCSTMVVQEYGDTMGPDFAGGH